MTDGVVEFASERKKWSLILQKVRNQTHSPSSAKRRGRCLCAHVIPPFSLFVPTMMPLICSTASSSRIARWSTSRTSGATSKVTQRQQRAQFGPFASRIVSGSHVSFLLCACFVFLAPRQTRRSGQAQTAGRRERRRGSGGDRGVGAMTRSLVALELHHLRHNGLLLPLIFCQPQLMHCFPPFAIHRSLFFATPRARVCIFSPRR